MPLQKPFRGISDLLGLYQGGNTLLELNSNLTPMIDALKFAAEPEWFFTSTSNAHAVGFRSTIQIPSDEVWILWALSGVSTIPIAAANNIGLMPVYQFQGAAGRELALTSQHQNNTFHYSAATAYATFAADVPGGLWCMDGAIGYLVTLRTGATNIQMDWGYQISKFKR
jgi:hypothetical protein